MSTFDLWQSACQGDLDRCLLVLDAPTEVDVRFLPPSPIPPLIPLGHLQVAVSGGGFIRSSDDVIRCGWSPQLETDCGEIFPLRATETKRLRAKMFRSGRFFRWGGLCAGAKPRCTVTMRRRGNARPQPFPVTGLFRRP
jgi:hypothetical protein